MTAMGAIDADAHVDESEATWAHMTPAEASLRPASFALSEERQFVAGDPRQHRLWLINGISRLRRFRDDKRTGTTRETRELIDIGARLAHMDALGIEVQVLYPTLLLHAVTTRADVELALCRSYNRWIAERTRGSNGRLRWAAMVPVLSIERAAEELRFARDHGACGFMKRGLEAGERLCSDPYFFPLYEEAERLGLPMCVHQGTGNPQLSNANDTGQLGALFVLAAFESLSAQSVPDRFPGLRFGFIEAGASWIPYLLKELRAKQERIDFQKSGYASNLLRRNRFYVTCDTLDDLPHLLQCETEDNLMIGTDYSHADASAELTAHSAVRDMAVQGKISKETAEKITTANARRFYGL